MGSYVVSPFGFKAGRRLSADEEALLNRWIALNREIVQGYWDGDIEYTEDALEQIQAV